MVSDNIRKVRERIERVCVRIGRKKEEVQIIAVTKTVPVNLILEAIRCGLDNIGESRVQESQDKFQSLHTVSPNLVWHMIGHLQRNKANRAVEIFDMIQSIDSTKLAENVNRNAAAVGKVQECLVEVKVSEEPAKSGVKTEELKSLLGYCQTLKNLRLTGLMVMAPFFEDKEKSRPYFTKAREIFERIFIPVSSFKAISPILSMGMSHDFEVAVEEGSNMVRIGSAIFGERRSI